ncbi:MAG: BACON domain-containing protein, partial [Bacteroidales bacterium]|nr:BACON domain-containing protein [Bacteroidales bacterium]
MKMKSLMQSLMALAIGLTLFSCAKENGKGAVEPSVSLTVTPAELVFDAAGGVDQTVTVTCDTYWKAYLDAEWLEIDMEDGYLNQTITVSVPDENTAAEPLTATLTIVAGRLEKVVTITQAAGAPYLKIAAEPADNFECEADTTAFEVASNQAWTAVSGAEWLTILGFED